MKKTDTTKKAVIISQEKSKGFTKKRKLPKKVRSMVDRCMDALEIRFQMWRGR